MRRSEDPASLAAETMHGVTQAGVSRVFHYNGKPAAVCGAIERWPGVWSAFAYGTDDFDGVAKAISAYAKNEMAPILRGLGAHRMDCQSRYDHVQAHKWLAWLGAERESVLRGFGKDGADYYNYVWKE